MSIELHWDDLRYADESAALSAVASKIDGGVLVLGTDFTQPERTVAALIAARRRGTPVAIYPLLEEPMEMLIAQISATLSSHAQSGERFTQFAALREGRLTNNGKPLNESVAYAPAALSAAILSVKLADIVLLATIAERDRWVRLLGRPLRRFAYLPLPTVEPAKVLDESGVTVYAPQTPRKLLAFVEFALSEARVSAVIVSAENSDAPITTRTVIAPSWWRPLVAARLASAGHRVVAAAPGAPDERCACATYREVDIFALGAAIDAAQSAPRTEPVSHDTDDLAPSLQMLRVSSTHGPRVSVIVRTYDRLQLLRRAIRSIVGQQYEDVEIVVVNNGGDDVEAMVRLAAERLPLIYTTNSRRGTISEASNIGVRAATGTYVAYLDDDDILYPDHIARAVDVLERTKTDLAYTNCVAEYAQLSGDVKSLLGFQIFLDKEFVAKELYMLNVAPIHSIVHRRDVFERFGYFDDSLPVTDDWEYWLRLVSNGCRFVHIDRATCEYSWRHDPQRGNMTLSRALDFAESYATITTRYASDLEPYPHLLLQQAQILAGQRQRADQLAQIGERGAEISLSAMAQNAVRSNVPEDPFADS
jgi:hypothetical protein